MANYASLGEGGVTAVTEGVSPYEIIFKHILGNDCYCFGFSVI
jgi:hypothetical protein